MLSGFRNDPQLTSVCGDRRDASSKEFNYDLSVDIVPGAHNVVSKLRTNYRLSHVRYSIQV